MKKVEGTINPFELDDLKAALFQAGIDGMTISEVRSADGTARTRLYRGAAYDVDFLPRLKVEVLLSDERVKGCIDAFVRCATARDAGGDIVVVAVDDAIRIRTGEHLVRADRPAHANAA